MTPRNHPATLALFALGLCVACQPQAKPDITPSSGTGAGPALTQRSAAPSATATIEARSGSTVSGTASFTPTARGLEIKVTVAGATPGLHGVHIHEKGDCSDPEGKSAGGHFNPAGVKHGGPMAMEHHPGDFGNITVGADGTGTLELTTEALTTTDAANSVIGRGLIVHEKPDDLVTQPTGNAGGRVGCGVVTAIK